MMMFSGNGGALFFIIVILHNSNSRSFQSRVSECFIGILLSYVLYLLILLSCV